jgi:hypothetical protein
MDTIDPRAAGDADPAPDRPAADLVPDGRDDVKVERDGAGQNDDSDVPWAGIGVVVVVLVAGAFVTGWHFGRRWGRLMGW